MFFRIVIAVIAVASATTAVIAQSDPIEARRKEMKAMGSHIYGALEPDAARAGALRQGQGRRGLRAIRGEPCRSLPTLFPEGSKSGTKPGEEFRTSDKIWTDKKEFEGRFAKLAKDAADSRAKITNVDTLKAAYAPIRQHLRRLSRNLSGQELIFIVEGRQRTAALLRLQEC